MAWCYTVGRTSRASSDDHDGEPDASPKLRGAKSRFKSKPPARDDKDDVHDEPEYAMDIQNAKE